MTEKSSPKSHDEYLEAINDLWWLHKNALEDRHKAEIEELHRNLAELIEKGKEECDLTIAEVAEELRVSRMTVNRILVKEYGIRDEQKQDAAKMGHNYTGS